MTVVLIFVIMLRLLVIPWLPMPESLKPWKGKSAQHMHSWFTCCSA